ncbi:putative membrane protein [Flavobacterium haoranii]|uniref:Putative membrane protein n=2 Tax=Flavobacterium haoranii TaxID=683124 RepID=A0A1M6JVB4_9FLAO|nr:putative membrane protein [Flavobacterium haoranii]
MTMRKIFPDYLLITLKGIAMGAADVVPGVSGGTIAFISGIYQELIDSINKINIGTLKTLKNNGFKAAWGSVNGNFLLALLSGIAISVLTFSKIITHLLETQPILVWSFFFGLVIASIVFIWKEITHWHLKGIIALLIGTILSYYITIAEPTSSPDSYPYLFLSGFLAIIAMILPGVSGAFILLLMGSYQTVIGTINQLREGLTQMNTDLLLQAFTKLAVFAGGAILGLKLFSRVLTWMFAHHKNTTLAMLIGFMIGSLNKIWPWKEVLETRVNSHGETVPFIERSILPIEFVGEPKIFGAIIMALIGFFLIFGLEKLAFKLGKTNS